MWPNTRRPLSPNVVIVPPKNLTYNRSDKRSSFYPKTTLLFQPDARLFSTQLQDSKTLKKPEIPKSISVTEPQKFLPKTTFQQQGPSAFQNRQRSQSPKHNFRNRSMENQNQTTVTQATPQVIYQPICDPRGLTKLKMTEFSGDPLEWPEWAKLFDVIMHQKRLSNTEKMQYLKISLTGQAMLPFLDWVSDHRHINKPGTISAKNLADRVIVESQLKIYTHPPVRHNDSRSIVRFSNVVTNTVKILLKLDFSVT